MPSDHEQIRNSDSEVSVKLLGRIELYLRRSGTPPTRFGRDAARDPRLVFDLRRGRELRPRLESRILAFLDEAERRVGIRRGSG
jgi:hypothetical protein